MSPAAARLLAALLLVSGLRAEEAAPAVAPPPAPPPEKIVRFEQMLVRSPGPGRAFDEVFGHWFASGGPAALEARWLAARDSAPAGSPSALAYGLLLGQLAERIGDIDTARARYAEAAAAAPSDFRAWHRLGRLEIREGKLPAGLAALEKAAESPMPPADAQDVLRDLARARSRALDEAGALQAWKDLAARFPDDAPVLEEVGQAQLDADAYDDAAETFAALEKAAAGDAYRAVLARLRLGEVAARKGDKDAALARFSAALDGTHRDSWLHREAQARVDSLFRDQGDFDGLVAFHEARLAGASRDPAAARRLADLLLELGRADAALAWLDKAAGWTPDDHALRFAHIQAMIAAEKGDDALPLLQTLVKRQPREAAYRVALGQLHWDRAKAAAAPETDIAASSASLPAPAAAERALALETWAALAPADAPVADLLALAEIYRAHDLAEETRATLARALAAEPASYDLRERLALQLLAMGRDAEAWQTARGGASGLADAGQYRRLAQLEKRNDLLDEALASADRGLALAPENYDLLDLRWQLLAELKRWDDALALHPRLLAAAPGDFALETIETRHVQTLRSAEKADAVLAALAARVAAADPSLTETDHRLHLRLLLARTEGGSPGDIPAAFAAARARFPDSFAIARLEVDHLDFAATLAERDAALRRLVVLRPERAPEWLRRMANNHRLERDLDGARAIVAELLALAPSDAQNHVLAAELEFEAEKTDAGLAALQRALRLASDPAPVRARLARAYLDQDKPAAALALHEEAFHAATEASARRALIPSLVESAVAAGDLDGVITRFTERARPRRDTADYQIELGELAFAAQDIARARQAWARALEIAPDDTRLVARLADIARQDGDSAEILRLARLNQRVAPSPAHAIALGEALLETDAAEEALEIFRAHAAYFYTDTALLARVLPVLAARGLAEPLVDRLRAESAAAADPAERDLALAGAFITIGDLARAETLLWEVYRRPPAAVPPTPPAIPATAPGRPGGPRTETELEIMLVYRSVQTVETGYQSAVQLLDAESGGRYRSHHARLSGGGYTNLPPNPVEFQDTALGYLGALAVRQDRAPAFLAALEAEFAARRLPASIQIIEFAKVQAPEAALARLDAALAEPAPSLPALFITMNLLGQTSQRKAGPGAAPDSETLARTRAVEAAIIRLGPPEAVFDVRMRAISQRSRAGDFDEAVAELDALAASPELTDMQRKQLALYSLNLRSQAGRWDGYLQQLRRVFDAEPTINGQAITHYINAYLLREDQPAGPDLAELDLLAALLLDAYARPQPVGPAQHFTQTRHGGRGSMPALHQELYTLLQQGAPSRDLPELHDYALQSFADLPESARSAFIERLLALAAARDEAALRLARAFALRIALLSEDSARAEALAALLQGDTPDLALVFNLAEFDYRADRRAAALARYATIDDTAGALSLAARVRELEIAVGDNDTEAAKTAATRLVALRPPTHLPALDLDTTLRELGLERAAGTVVAARPAPSAPRRSTAANSRQIRQERARSLLNDLEKAVAAKDDAETARLARASLQSSPLSAARKGDDGARRQTLRLLARAGLIDAYIDELDARLAATPDSALALELLAEAHASLLDRDDSTRLAPVAASAAALDLPLRLRLVRRGDTLVASHASALPAPDGAPGAGEPAWIELGSVTLADLGAPLPGLAGRNQHFSKFEAGRFEDIRRGDRALGAADFPKRDTLRLDNTSAVFLGLDSPFADGDSFEAVLAPAPDAKTRVPVSRGLVLRDPRDQRPRLALMRTDDGVLRLAVRRHTGALAPDLLGRVVELRPRDEAARERYLESLRRAGRIDEAVAFISRPANAELLISYANRDYIIKHLRESGRLEPFVLLVTERAVARATRPGQYPNVEHQVLELARRLRDSGDPALAFRIWETVLPVLRDSQASEIRAEFAAALIADGAPASRDRAVALVREQFIPPPRVEPPPPLVFANSVLRYGNEQPWYANANYSGAAIHSPALGVLDRIDDPGLFRALLADIQPEVVKPDASWQARCFDLALRLRLADATAAPAFARLWDAARAEELATTKRQPYGNPPGPLAGFLPACFFRLVGLPDPDGLVAARFSAALDLFPADGSRRVPSGRSYIAQNPWNEFAIRFAQIDYFEARGDTAAARAAREAFAASLARQDPRQINTQITGLLLARFISAGEIAAARRLYETGYRRVLLRQGGRGNLNNPAARNLASLLDALDCRGEPPAPALAAWVSPDSAGVAALRWEITTAPAADSNSREGSQPPIIGQPRANPPDGLHDLVVEFAADAKSPAITQIVRESIPARGALPLTDAPASGWLRATLRPRAGGDPIVLAPQLYSTAPNLLPNPLARPAAPGAEPPVPGWSLALPAIVQNGGPSPSAQFTRFNIPSDNQNERLTRTAPIPISAGKAYLVAAWAAVAPDGYAHLGIEFLDAAGKPLANNRVTRHVNNDDPRWQRLVFSLSADNKRSLPNQTHIPSGAASFRLLVSGHSGLSLADLVVQELPEPPKPATP